MIIFAYEFITGGGLAREPLPANLAREGNMMLRALANDLLELEDVDVTIGRDPRLDKLPRPVEAIAPAADEDPLAHFARVMRGADAVWPIAPETGGMLESLTRLVEDSGKVLLGCDAQSVGIAASKLRTAQWLARAGIAVVPTYRAHNLPDRPGAWIVKPDDGAGCTDMRRFDSGTAARAHLAARPGAHLAARPGANLVAQPWLDGEAFSLSMLCCEGMAQVLSCNRQHVRIGDGRIVLEGITVNAAPVDDTLQVLARDIARALPGLWGYVGVDFVVHAGIPTVIEINPRLTTSYCGLRPAFGINAAAAVLALKARGKFDPGLSTFEPVRPVDIVLEH